MPSNPPVKKKRICIIGAGAAGQNKSAYSCIEYKKIKLVEPMVSPINLVQFNWHDICIRYFAKCKKYLLIQTFRHSLEEPTQ